MESTNGITQTTNNNLFEQVEAQLRGITGNLEQLGLDAALIERLISLTFIDILKELVEESSVHNATPDNTKSGLNTPFLRKQGEPLEAGGEKSLSLSRGAIKADLV